VAGVAGLLLTRVFVDFDKVRIKLIQHATTPSDRSVRVVTDALDALVALQQPSALIAKIDNPGPKDDEFTITVDGRIACRPRVSAGASRRADCVVTQWTSSDGFHEIAIDGPAGAWTVSYLEAATHYGNTGEPSHLIILPRESSYYVRPSSAATALLCLVVAATMLFASPAVFPAWAIWCHRALSGIILVAISAVVASPWMSRYRVVLSLRTLWWWLAVLGAPYVWTACRFVAATHALPGKKSARFAQSAIVASGVLAVFWIVMTVRLHDTYQGNYSGFLQISRRLFEANPALSTREDLRPGVLLLDNGGYDGQFMYYTAFDPLMRAFRHNPARYRDVVDAVPYRFGRIGFGLLTRVLSGGRAPLYPATMMWLILFSLLALSFLLGTMAQREQITPLVGALVVLVPGFWQSMQAALPEPVAAAALVGGIAAAARARPGLAGILFAVSLLVRETGVVMVCCAVGAMALSGRWRTAFLVGFLAVGPVLAWRVYVGWTLLPDWGLKGFWDQPADLGWPFAGFGHLWQVIRSGDYFGGNAYMARAGISYPLLLVAALGVASALALTAPSAVNVAVLCYAIIAVSLNFDMIWVHVGNGQRGTYEVFLILALSVMDIRRWSRTLQFAVALLWCAAGAYVFWGAFDAQDIRAALFW
jgi:hypothetical protein